MNCSRFILTLLLIPFVAGILTKSSCYGSSKTNIFITVDVEDFASDFPLDMVWGMPDKPYGIQKIMEIIEENGFKGTFFVDVYEWKMYGKDKMKEVCKEINRRGHDVELHTHPVDTKTGRKWMYEYTIDEQKKLLEEGAGLIKEWIGRYPVAHRAGGYAANYDTLKALESIGIKIDSSMFYQHQLCKLNIPVLTINKTIKTGSLLEIPVSVVYRIAQKVQIGGIRLIRKNLFLTKLDIDWINSDQIIEGIQKIRDNGNDNIVIFLHSWSLINGAGKWSDTAYQHYEPDLSDIKKMKAILSFLKDNQDKYEVITFDDYAKRLSDIHYGSHSAEVIPALKEEEINVFYWLYEKYGRLIKIGFLLLLLISTIVIIKTLKKKREKE